MASLQCLSIAAWHTTGALQGYGWWRVLEAMEQRSGQVGLQHMECLTALSKPRAWHWGWKRAGNRCAARDIGGAWDVWISYKKHQKAKGMPCIPTEDACGVSSPRRQAICGYSASLLMTKIKFFCDFVVILEVQGPPTSWLHKRLKQIPVRNPSDLCFWTLFSNMLAPDSCVLCAEYYACFWHRFWEPSGSNFQDFGVISGSIFWSSSQLCCRCCKTPQMQQV